MKILALLAGLFSGLIGSMGLGGGAVLIIYLSVFANTKQLKSGGINLLFFIPIALFSVIIYNKKGLIKWKTVIPIAIGGIIGGFIGIFLAEKIGNNLLSKAFGIFLCVLGLKEIITTVKLIRKVQQ